jgi:hypothetical protein
MVIKELKASICQLEKTQKNEKKKNRETFNLIHVTEEEGTSGQNVRQICSLKYLNDTDNYPLERHCSE